MLACGRRLRVRLARPLCLARRPRRQGRPYILRLSRYQTGPGLGLGPDDRPCRRCRRGTATSSASRSTARRNPQVPVLPHDQSQGGARRLGAGSRTIGRSAASGATGPAAITSKRSRRSFADPAIVNPAEAPAEGRLRVCGQCHSYHQESPLPRTDPFWIRFQGTTLPWSRCYTESNGSFDCMTCHDPHHDTDRSEPKHYTARCLTCHSAGPGRRDKGPTRKIKDPPDPACGAARRVRSTRRRAASAATCRRSKRPSTRPSPTITSACVPSSDRSHEVTSNGIPFLTPSIGRVSPR